MRTSRRPLYILSAASLGWAFSFGVGAPLASLWLEHLGASSASVGLNTSLYYLGVALCSPFVAVLMRRANRACIVGGMVLDGAITIAFPYFESLIVLHGLRLLAGAGTALSLIPMETLVNHDAPPERRARDFAVYAFCVASGIGLGSVVGFPLYPVSPKLAFLVGGLVTLAAVPLGWVGSPVRYVHEEAGGSGDLSPRREVLSFGTAWAQGFLEGGTLAFLSLYLFSLGHEEGRVGALMGGLFAGVVTAQLPLAALADRFGRRRVVLACHGLLLAGLLLVPLTRGPLMLALELFVLGACCGALYPLGLALLGERVAPCAMAKANAWYLAANGAGSLTGPLVIGLVIDAFGQRAQFPACAVVVLGVLLIAAALRRGAQPSFARLMTE